MKHKMVMKLDVPDGFADTQTIDFILDEGLKGNHLLFDHETIRQAFADKSIDLIDVLESRLEEVNEVINDIFLLDTFEQKKSYLKSLDKDMQNALVEAYFQLLDSREDVFQSNQLH